MMLALKANDGRRPRRTVRCMQQNPILIQLRAIGIAVIALIRGEGYAFPNRRVCSFWEYCSCFQLPTVYLQLMLTLPSISWDLPGTRRPHLSLTLFTISTQQAFQQGWT